MDFGPTHRASKLLSLPGLFTLCYSELSGDLHLALFQQIPILISAVLDTNLMRQKFCGSTLTKNIQISITFFGAF